MIFGDGEYDRDMDIAVNRREAWEDGHEEGREEGLVFTARNVLAKGISVKTVQENTGLFRHEAGSPLREYILLRFQFLSL